MNTEPEGSLVVDIQIATNDENIPANKDFNQWFKAALPEGKHNSEVTIRIVGIDESRKLNKRYRQKDSPTNVLSFPAELPEAVELPLLGDLVICASIVEQEASEQHKAIEAHWAHMVVHGTLHLLGYDHINDDEAEQMENLETKIMNSLGYPNPYKPH